MARRWSLLGEGPQVAARQIALLLAGCGLLTLAVLPALSGGPRGLGRPA
jgi:hypothetical protein